MTSTCPIPRPSANTRTAARSCTDRKLGARRLWPDADTDAFEAAVLTAMPKGAPLGSRCHRSTTPLATRCTQVPYAATPCQAEETHTSRFTPSITD